MTDTTANGARPPDDRLPDIKPRTPVAALDRRAWLLRSDRFPVERVAPAVGMSPSFVRRVVGGGGLLGVADVLDLLDQDAYSETFVPRSRVLAHLASARPPTERDTAVGPEPLLLQGSATVLVDRLAAGSVQSVVTSSPYWGTRVYKDSTAVEWADGERSAYGHEQTPEGFVRHTVQVLEQLRAALAPDASVWWNVMDTYNTRTQVRGNAAEALRAMQGRDGRAWGEHDVRRYSAGHSHLKDGEQCLIPFRIAERAGRIGYHVKSVITWAKTASLPEPQTSRVSRRVEYVLHLAPTRTPLFDKEAYRRLPPSLGGRNAGEPDRPTDLWVLPTSAGRGGHGAQFPVALAARCIALGSREGDLVLDPFVGAGTTGVAAAALGRRFVGMDVSPRYLAEAAAALAAAALEGVRDAPRAGRGS